MKMSFEAKRTRLKAGRSLKSCRLDAAFPEVRLDHSEF